jgi:hypothetical protein
MVPGNDGVDAMKCEVMSAIRGGRCSGVGWIGSMIDAGAR